MQNDNQNNQEGQFSDDMQDEMTNVQGERPQGAKEAGVRGGRGFAGMSQQKRREIAAKGGRSQGRGNNSGNFANNRDKAVAAGRLGGQHSRGGGRQTTREPGHDSIDLSALGDAE
ncbi:MAG TPA: KGG domain-containing protein [Candidatus Paceibacterota bacterium]